MRWPVLGGLLLGSLACSGPCGGPEAATVQWLDDVAARRDADALGAYELPHDAPVPFDAVRFGKRADRLPLLRDHDRVEITAVTWRRSDYWRDNDPLGSIVIRGIQSLDRRATVDAVLYRGEELADLKLQFHRGKLGEVEARGVRLVPRSNYHVIELPARLDEAPRLREVEVGWRQWGESWFVEVAGQLDSAALAPGLTVTTLCREGDRLYRHATTSGHSSVEQPGWRSFSLSDRVGDGARPSACEVELEVSDGDRRAVRWCLGEEAADGECPFGPAPSGTGPGPVAVDQVDVEVDGASAAVHYVLHPNEPMPVRYNTPDHATLVTELRCAGRVAELHRRPLHRENDVPGVHRRYGSVFVAAEGRYDPPCDVVLRFVRDDGYDREDFVAWEGTWPRSASPAHLGP